MCYIIFNIILGFCCGKKVSILSYKRYGSCSQWVEVSSAYSNVKSHQKNKIWKLGLPLACKNTDDERFQIICAGNDVFKQAQKHAQLLRDKQNKNNSSKLSIIITIILCTFTTFAGLILASYLLPANIFSSQYTS